MRRPIGGGGGIDVNNGNGKDGRSVKDSGDGGDNIDGLSEGTLAHS
jgi:hypothetical protein